MDRIKEKLIINLKDSFALSPSAELILHYRMDKIEVEISKELVQKVLEDDKNAILSFLKLTEPLVWGSLHSYNQLNKEEKEDLFQSIYFKLFDNHKRRIRMWKQKSKFTSFLYMIVANTILDYLKSAGRKHSVEHEDIQETINLNFSFNPQYAHEDLFSLKIAIKQLKPEEQEIIQLFYFQQLKEREIAEQLSKPINTISSMKNRALKKLKDSLQEN